MSRYAGILGFKNNQIETRPGIYENETVEHQVKGDVTTIRSAIQNGDKKFDNISLNNVFSVIFDEFLKENFRNLIYVIYDGIKWKVVSVEVKHPRLNIVVGDIYHD